MRASALLAEALLLLPLAAGPALYQVDFHFKTQIKKGKVLFIPYRAYYELHGEVVFRAEPADWGFRFRLHHLPSPPWLIVTVGFSAEEVHCRTAWFSVQEGVEYGRKVLEEWRKENPYFSSRIRPSRIKPLPFLLPPLEGDDFTFATDRSFRTLKGRTHNRLRPVYPWPAHVDMFMNFFDILAAILDEVASMESTPSIRLDFSPFFNRLGPTFHPIVKFFVRFHQERPISFTQRFLDGTTWKLLRGWSFPDVKIWGSFRIKEFEREAVFEREQLLCESFFMRVENDRGDGGFAWLKIKRLGGEP